MLSGDVITIDGEEVRIPYYGEGNLTKKQWAWLHEQSISVRILRRPRLEYDIFEGELVHA
jgi:hypothetical protein